MIGKIQITSTGYDPTGPRVYDPTLEPPPAADPWVKIEPGCEMPEIDCPVVMVDEYECVLAGTWGGSDFWSNGHVIRPTHYAVLRMPED